jgi:F-type H+-transporting ATPase subunit delta
MASVVGVYARAFADVMFSSKLDSRRMLQELHAVEALLGESVQLRRVMVNPSIPGDRKRAVLDVVAQKMGLARQVRNFIAVVTDHRRLPLLAEILKQLEQELNERMGVADAEIVSARELGESERKLLEAEVARLTGKHVRAHYRQDASLLGGALVKVGSTVYDGSVSEQLERIREQLVEASS